MRSWLRSWDMMADKLYSVTLEICDEANRIASRIIDKQFFIIDSSEEAVLNRIDESLYGKAHNYLIYIVECKSTKLELIHG